MVFISDKNCNYCKCEYVCMACVCVCGGGGGGGEGVDDAYNVM